MSKTYHSNWDVKKLLINFNQKQWRQDFGAYVKAKKFWPGIVKVTRAKVIKKSISKDNPIKSFEVYNAYGGSVIVSFQNESIIIDTTDKELVEQYFKEREVNSNG